MTKFQQIVEEWVRRHIDFSHDPSAKASAKEKAFYVIDTINDQNEFVRNHTTAHTPCVAVSSLVDASLSNGKAQYLLTVYFLAKGKNNMSKTQKQDDRQNAAVNEQLNEYVLEFLAWLQDYKRKHQGDPAVAGIEIDGAEWATIPILYNDWHILPLELTQVRALNKCFVTSHYQEIED